jgi:hypothetical protein
MRGVVATFYDMLLIYLEATKGPAGTAESTTNYVNP